MPHRHTRSVPQAARNLRGNQRQKTDRARNRNRYSHQKYGGRHQQVHGPLHRQTQTRRQIVAELQDAQAARQQQNQRNSHQQQHCLHRHLVPRQRIQRTVLPGLRRLRLLQITARNQIIIHGTEHRTHRNTNQHHLLTHRRATARTRQKHHHSRRRKTANNSAHAHTHAGRTQRPNQHHRQGTGRRTHREADNIRRAQSIT